MSATRCTCLRGPGHPWAGGAIGPVTVPDPECLAYLVHLLHPQTV